MACGASVGCDFDYELAQHPLMRAIEHCVRGSDYGATSWATQGQVRQSVTRLRLAPGMQLLDVGSGSGWPALSLASLSGCAVVLTDLPHSGLRIARDRARQDGLTHRCRVLAAGGAMLPFADGAFDRIHHADVLCCLQPKREVLRECRRVARPRATMEFSVISQAREPYGDEERQLLERSGPPHPEVEMDYPALLSTVGWSVLERIDVTSEFARGMGVLLEQMQVRRDALLALLGEQNYAERMEHRQSGHAAISRGLLKREIFLVG